MYFDKTSAQSSNLVCDLVQFDASRARFLLSSDHFPDTRDEEIGLDVSKHLEDISTVAQLDVGIVQDALGQDGLLADEGNPDSGIIFEILKYDFNIDFKKNKLGLVLVLYEVKYFKNTSHPISNATLSPHLP